MSSDYTRMDKKGGGKATTMPSSTNFMTCCLSCTTFFGICACCCFCLIAAIIITITVGLYINQLLVLGGYIIINRQEFEVASFNVTTNPNKFYLVTKIVYGIKNTASRELKITNAEINIYYEDTLVGSSTPRSSRTVPPNSELKPNLELDIEVENMNVPQKIINDMRTELQTTGKLKLTFRGVIGVFYHYQGEIPILTFEESINEK